MNERVMNNEEQDIWANVHAAEHSMQSAVAIYLADGDDSATPKHLRVGLNNSMSNQGALVELLVEKGLFTATEYAKSCLKYAKKEAEDAAERARAITGNPNLTFR